MKPEVRYLDIGSVSSLEIRLPVLEIGSGQPVLSVLCSLHGDEGLGLLACHQFIDQLEKSNRLHGTVRVVPVANPVAQANSSRIGNDYLDLNRIGKGNPQGSLTERLGASLYTLLSDSALVVDLHEFEMRTPLLAIYIKSEDTQIDSTILCGIATFAPRLVWRLDFDLGTEATYSTSLIAALIRSGVPCFAVEGSISRHESNIPAIAAGLRRLAQWLGIFAGKPVVPSQTVAYRRHLVTANMSGIWTPRVELFQGVTTTRPLGCLTSIDLQRESLYQATSRGVVLQVREHQLVQTGTSVCALGTLDTETTTALASSLASLLSYRRRS